MNFRQVHLDFHTSEKVPSIGSKFNKAQFQAALKLGHVNSITVFSKCHHGWAYHPSEANEMHPELDFDLLGAQIEAAHEIGVKTPVYLSAGFDEKVALQHPEWLLANTIDAFTPKKSFTTAKYHLLCMNTPYLDYLLEQIKEVCRNYDADGIFLDIVGVRRCGCQACIRTALAQGLDITDDNTFWTVGEQTYQNYLRRVREAVDSVKPGLPVFHNSGHIPHGRRDLAAANSHLELESLPTGSWGYDHFPMSARYVQNLGMEYISMTGKFHLSWGEFGGYKHPNALRYEVGLAAAHGAKCSIGDQMHPSGEMDMATYQLIGTAYGELEEKESWLDHVTQLADIAVLSYGGYLAMQGIHSPKRTQDGDTGALRILNEGHYLYDFIDMDADFDRYKVIILPDQVRVSPALKEKLDAYLAKGGKILATGKSALYAAEDAFAFDFGAEYAGESPYTPTYLRPMFPMEGLYDTSYVLYNPSALVRLTTGTVLGEKENPYFNRTFEHFCSHRHAPCSGESAGPGVVQGKDGIYISWSIFSNYATDGSLICKRVVQHALDLLLGSQKTLTTNLPAQGVATVMEQKAQNRYVHHLLYAVPVLRGNIQVIEQIVPVHDVHVELKLPRVIKNVYLAPQMTAVPFTQENGVVHFILDKLDCHQMVVLDY